jgi:hypothetical protein
MKAIRSSTTPAMLAHHGLLADPGLREASRLLLEKLGFDPEWLSELVRAN